MFCAHGGRHIRETASIVDRWLWRLGILDPASPLRINLPIVGGIIAFHLLALLACIPWLFSWSGLAWALLGLYLFGTLGVNIGFHRLLTHRGFSCPIWLEHGLSVLGTCCRQGTPMNWVAIHRMHHQYSDEPGDPHSPRSSFFWSHMGWFLIRDPAIYNADTYDRYVRDLFRDRFYKWLERPQTLRTIYRVQSVAFLGLGALVGALTSGSLWGALQLGLSWLVWGVFVRTVAVWHITWSVNSITHIWGYRNFPTRDNSFNNWVVGLISNGEGWHNNHHAEPRCASHGRRWWELDVSYLSIRALELAGLASEVVHPGRPTLDGSDELRGAA
ncbi:MAG TPA: fatty acid desaturase [Gemmataceae bacterium]|nr:fatty acid desaturase [Gemmataceae bacterium]